MSARKTLTLNGDADDSGTKDQTDGYMVVDHVEVLLPCRRFNVHYQVSDTGRQTLTIEFLMRLLKLLGSVKERDFAEFFGYSDTEAAFIVSSAETQDLVRRTPENDITLTTHGDSQFHENQAEPNIYEIKKETRKFVFDLISMAPCDGTFLSSINRGFPTLEVKVNGVYENSSELV